MKKLIVIFLFYSICLFGENNLPIVGNIIHYYSLNKSMNLSKIKDNDADYAIIEAKDGTSVLISQPSFQFVQLEKVRDIWKSRTNILPITCNLNNLNRIILFKPDCENNIEILDKDNSQKMTAFDAYFVNFKKLGSSQKNGFSIVKLKKKSNSIFDYKKAELVFADKSKKNLIKKEIAKITIKDGKFYYQKQQIKQIRILEK
jgi:hypothetical protein